MTEQWSPACHEALDELKKLLTSAPILTYPQFDKPYLLYTGTLCEAIRVVLCQVWTAEAYPTPEPEKTLLAFVALGGEDLEYHYTSDHIFFNA